MTEKLMRCASKCENILCGRNKRNVTPKDEESVVSWSAFQFDCTAYTPNLSDPETTDWIVSTLVKLGAKFGVLSNHFIERQKEIADDE